MQIIIARIIKKLKNGEELSYSQKLIYNKFKSEIDKQIYPNKKIIRQDRMEIKFKKAINSGCVIWKAKCSCGGNYAWLTPTGRGTMKMYGCICHNEPPTIKKKQ